MAGVQEITEDNGSRIVMTVITYTMVPFEDIHLFQIIQVCG